MFTCTCFKILASCDLRIVLLMVLNNCPRSVLQMSQRLQGRERKCKAAHGGEAEQGGADQSLPLACP